MELRYRELPGVETRALPNLYWPYQLVKARLGGVWD